jgi:hypothetical protein
MEKPNSNEGGAIQSLLQGRRISQKRSAIQIESSILSIDRKALAAIQEKNYHRFDVLAS